MTSTHVYRVGIAGYGVVGKRRRRFIDEHANLDTVAVCDQDFRGSGTLSDGVRYHQDYRRLLEEPLDVLFVSLPNYLAPEVTIAGLQHQLHVFCEKPPGRTVADILKVRKVEARHPDKLLKYGFNHRYHGSVRKALEIIEEKRFGEIVNVRGVYGKSKIIPFEGGWRAERRQAGGGILLDQGIHMVDLLRLFCGEFTEVKSYVSNSYWGHDVEDNVFALMRDARGRIAMLHSSATQWTHRFALEVAFEEGYLELRGLLSGSKSYGEEKLFLGARDESVTGTAMEECIVYLEDNSWRDEIRDFAQAIVSGGTVQSGDSKDALNTMKLVYRIYYSDPTWREMFNIESPDLPWEEVE